MKRVLKIFAIIAIIASLSLSAFATYGSTETAIPTPSTVLINGTEVEFEAYNINGNNYFKLRDIAMALIGTEVEIHVEWVEEEQLIAVYSNGYYEPLGTELSLGDGTTKNAILSDFIILFNEVEITPTVYNIDGYSFFKLRDLGEVINFGIDWIAESSTISIDTTKEYVPESTTTPPEETSTGEYVNNVEELIGTYVGEYTANQGITGLTLEVYEENDTVKALFNFYPLPENHTVKTGTYYCEVAFNEETQSFEIIGDEWLRVTSSYSMVNILNAKFDGNNLSGDIDDGEGLSDGFKVSVDRVEDYNSGDEIIGDYTGTYVAAQGVTGLDLNIYREGRFIKADFIFYPTEENPDVASGHYVCYVSYNPAMDVYSVHGDEWVENIGHYSFVDILNMKLDESGLTGEIDGKTRYPAELVKN